MERLISSLLISERSISRLRAVHAFLACTVLLVCICFQSTARAAEAFIVLSSDAAPYEAARDALQRKLGKAGYKTHAYVLKDFREEFAKAPPSDPTNCFVAVGSEAAVALHKCIPAANILVYCLVAEPLSLGLTVGRQTYGIDTAVPMKAQFGLIGEALPKARALGILLRSNDDESAKLTKAVKDELPAGWKLETVFVDAHASVSKAVDALFERKIDVVWTVPDNLLYDQAVVRSLLLASIRRKIPVFGYSLGIVKAGALLGATIDPQKQGTQAADLLESIRTGKVPASQLPEVPEFDIAVNLIVAERISINLPESFVQRARQVVKSK